MILQEEPSFVRDLIAHCMGARLGHGVGRVVYEWLPDPTLVAKVETVGRSFQNVFEWQTWDRIKDTEHAKWFAPCVAIAPNGVLLLQKRTTPATKKNLPTSIPIFFTDLKIENWGLLNKKPVCHDYGLHLLMEQGMTRRVCKAAWWSSED